MLAIDFDIGNVVFENGGYIDLLKIPSEPYPYQMSLPNIMTQSFSCCQALELSRRVSQGRQKTDLRKGTLGEDTGRREEGQR